MTSKKKYSQSGDPNLHTTLHHFTPLISVTQPVFIISSLSHLTFFILFFKFNIYHPRPALALGRFQIIHLHPPFKISLSNCLRTDHAGESDSSGTCQGGELEVGGVGSEYQIGSE